MQRVPLEQALARREQVLPALFDEAERLRAIPTRHAKRLVVLDHIARVFEIGVRYPEVEVNAVLRALHPDYAALHRYLVDDEFLSRDGRGYWRSGGTIGG